MSWGRICTLSGVLGLIVLGTLGIVFWVPPKTLPIGLLVSVFSLPLLLPLRGVINGSKRSHAWLGFLSFAYFIVGVDVAFNRVGDERLFGWAVIVLSVVMCFGTMGYIRKDREVKPKSAQETEN